MQFDMNRTWSQAIGLVQANFQLLAIIAGVFMLLPAVVFYSAMPEAFTMFKFTADPKAMDAEMATLLPKLLTYGLIAFAFQMVGYLTMIALIGGGRPTVGESILRGIKAVPTVIGATILCFIAYMLLALALGLVIGLLAAAAIGLAGSSTGGVVVIGAVSVLLYLFLIVVVAYFGARLSPLLPVIVLEPQYNPVKALARAWRLTKPKAWAILGFFLLLFVCYLVISIVFFTVLSAFGMIAGAGVGGASVFVMGLFGGVLGAAVAMLFSAILVSLHQQLAGFSRERLNETFE